VIGHVAATEVAEHEVKVEAQINPGGLEAAYSIWLVRQQADPKGGPTNDGEPPTGGPQTQTGKIAAGSGYWTVSATLTGLQWGYTYYGVVAASNSACEKAKGEFEIALHISGEFPNGQGTGSQYESEIPCWVTELSNAQSAKTRREYEAKQQQIAKEHEEQRAREAAALERHEEKAASATGGVSLADTSVTIRRNGMALVKLNCLGVTSCHGKLTLTATGTTKAKDRKQRSHTVTIGAMSFAISGDETKTVKLELNATGRALLSTDHGRLSAHLAILELEPNSGQTQSKSVSLVEQKTHGAHGRRR
jgi:hypothetical protein